MKITSAHLEALRAAIAPLDTVSQREQYRLGDFPRAELVKDLDKRYRWDLFYAVNGGLLISGGMYLDSHIDTALRAIVPPL